MEADTDTVTSVDHAQTVRFMTGLSPLLATDYKPVLISIWQYAAASMTILVYDWLLLLDDEVRFIWRSPSVFVKIIYLIIRYPTFTDISLTVVYIATIGTACTELVLIWRTFALWEKSRKVLIGLLIMWGVWVCGNIYPVIRFTESVVFVAQTLPGVPGCYLVSGDPIIFTCYATLLGVEIVIIILTLAKGIRTFRHTRSALVKTLYRDGILFFLLVTSSSLGNVLTLLLAPIEYTDLLNSLARVIHTVVCCRVVIHLRRAARRDELDGTLRSRRTSRSGLLSLRFWHSSQTDGDTAGGTTTDTFEMSDFINSTNLDTYRSVQKGPHVV
ncbi:hypothetical protein NM688_g1250 [Phlebia brevispora]|uniref:Uncharacterized protein n=1 Tax=Phlebia brevispora TaxID=194682 RepID=A0ACC1TBU4_9APHY|nr:hypothetical protein NM688_g1250 [Phlebia brevispora]